MKFGLKIFKAWTKNRYILHWT